MRGEKKDFWQIVEVHSCKVFDRQLSPSSWNISWKTSVGRVWIMFEWALEDSERDSIFATISQLFTKRSQASCVSPLAVMLGKKTKNKNLWFQQKDTQLQYNSHPVNRFHRCTGRATNAAASQRWQCSSGSDHKTMNQHKQSIKVYYRSKEHGNKQRSKHTQSYWFATFEVCDKHKHISADVVQGRCISAEGIAVKIKQRMKYGSWAALKRCTRGAWWGI